MGCTGEVTCTEVLARQQSWQSRHQAAMSPAMPDHTKRLDNIRLVALMPGWAMAWTAWKTAWRQGSGTRGRTVPADTSHHSSHPSTVKVRMLSEGEELAEIVAAHDRCSLANQA
jgi:hypothetical protein